VPRKVAMERFNRLSVALEEAGGAAASARVGRVVEVLLESLEPEEDWPEGTVAQGRTRGQAPEVDGRTFLEGPLPPFARVGLVIRAVVTDAMGYDLVAGWHAVP
jgi:ribosomal protein S12 methylthiotransferase